MQLLERQPKETGRDYALRVIKKNIILLELSPGSMVSENELAAEMGLSRTPVREALIELSKTGIVEIYPQKGSRVSEIRYHAVDEARFMRLVLECAVAELACETATPKDLDDLEDVMRLQELYLQNADSDHLLELDNTFHRRMFQICDKLLAYSLMDSMSAHFDRVRSMSLSSLQDIRIVEDHHAVVNAIRAKDAPAAKDAMEKHLSRYKVDEEVIRRKYPTYFDGPESAR